MHILYVYISIISYKRKQAYQVTILYVCFLLYQLQDHEEAADWSCMIKYGITSYMITGLAT